jgi:hypothetical protein
MVALLSPGISIKEVYANGADLVVQKPLNGMLVRRVLTTASNLLRREENIVPSETERSWLPAKPLAPVVAPPSAIS